MRHMKIAHPYSLQLLVKLILYSLSKMKALHLLSRIFLKGTFPFVREKEKADEQENCDQFRTVCKN